MNIRIYDFMFERFVELCYYECFHPRFIGLSDFKTINLLLIFHTINYYLVISAPRYLKTKVYLFKKLILTGSKEINILLLAYL